MSKKTVKGRAFASACVNLSVHEFFRLDEGAWEYPRMTACNCFRTPRAVPSSIICRPPQGPISTRYTRRSLLPATLRPMSARNYLTTIWCEHPPMRTRDERTYLLTTSAAPANTSLVPPPRSAQTPPLYCRRVLASPPIQHEHYPPPPPPPLSPPSSLHARRRPAGARDAQS
jgi:hypothetical protein